MIGNRTMDTADIVRPADLAASDREAWLDFCAATPAFRSPLLGPDFAEAVARRRDDAYVAVFRRGARPVGFLPHHRRTAGFDRPIGSPFSDYHALVTEPGVRLDGPEALAAAGIRLLRFSNLVDPMAAFDGVEQTPNDGYAIQIGPQGAEAYLDAVREPNPKRAKNWRRLENKLEREVGEIALRMDDRSPEAYESLVRWKSEQLLRSGLHDVFAPGWSSGLMRDLFETRGQGFEGFMVTLYAGGRLAAGHFGVRLNGHFHSWVSSVEPEFAASGAGNTLLLHAIAAMPAHGLETVDMGPGHGHYKEPFCSLRIAAGQGLAHAKGSGVAQHSAQQALTFAASRSEAVARLLRRLDHIAATEPSVGGRIKGVAQAFANQGKRAQARSPEPTAPAQTTTADA